MFRSRWFRFSALFAVLVTVFSLSAVGLAEARMGGSFGSRGMRTYQTIPATPTINAPVGGVQRSMTNPATPAATAAYGANYGRSGWFGGGLGGWMLGGLLGAGLFGPMFGGGFGGFGGVFSLIVQVAVLYFVVRWLFRRFGNRTATAGGYGSPYGYAPQQDWPSGSGGGGARSARSSSAASRRAGSRDEVGIGERDLAVFEQRLSQLQDGYAREDHDALRRIATPEVMSYLSEELARNAAQGLRNEVYDVALLAGDIAEAWREGERDYATVALRYESRDVMRERATGTIVAGDEGVSSKAEVWTFVRERGGEWMISAIQGA
jgi:predicted lipid-binding transport protein (Tim44 family)